MQRYIDPQEDSHVKMEAKAGVMQQQAKNKYQIAGTHKKLGEGHGAGFSSEPLEGINPADNLVLDFWPPKL